MTRYLRPLGTASAALAITIALSATAFARAPSGRPIPEPTVKSTTQSEDSGTSSNSSDDSSSNTSGTVTPKTSTTNAAPHELENDGIGSGPTTTAEVKSHLKSDQLKVCQNRSNVITTIITRANTRAQNQITLFTTVATRVENFYTSKGKTASNYDQLVATVNSAEAQAATDLATLKTNSTFSCSANNPSGVVSTYRTDLQTERSDLQTLRTAVHDLIIGVAKAEGYTLSTSATKGAQQ